MTKLFSADNDAHSEIHKSSPPSFRTENMRDETQILSDQDITNPENGSKIDENMGAQSHSLNSLEKESPDFMRGELDVKEQMDRTSEVIWNSIQGIQEIDGENDTQSELISSFQNTPGGIDEVIEKTDQFLSKHPTHAKPNK